MVETYVVGRKINSLPSAIRTDYNTVRTQRRTETRQTTSTRANARDVTVVRGARLSIIICRDECACQGDIPEGLGRRVKAGLAEAEVVKAFTYMQGGGGYDHITWPL